MILAPTFLWILLIMFSMPLSSYLKLCFLIARRIPLFIILVLFSCVAWYLVYYFMCCIRDKEGIINYALVSFGNCINIALLMYFFVL